MAVYGKREQQNVILISLLFLLRERKKTHLTSLRKWLKGRRQTFDYLQFDVWVNMGLNLSVFAKLSSVFGIGGHVCRVA